MNSSFCRKHEFQLLSAKTNISIDWTDILWGSKSSDWFWMSSSSVGSRSCNHLAKRKISTKAFYNDQLYASPNCIRRTHIPTQTLCITKQINGPLNYLNTSTKNWGIQRITIHNHQNTVPIGKHKIVDRKKTLSNNRMRMKWTLPPSESGQHTIEV